MSEEILAGLASPDEQRAAARSRAYQVFASAFGYPDGETSQAIREGELAEALRDVLTAIAPALLEHADWGALSDTGKAVDDLAVEFTRLFDVGASGPPCPLYGGLYGGARMKTMEEAVRFYNHFGLTLAESPRELPDHLTTQLEFLHYLCFREAQTLQAGDDPGPFRRAQRDFVSRHPGRWVSKLRQRVEGQKPLRFFAELVRQLDDFLRHEEATLTAELGAPSTDPRPYAERH